MTTPTPAAKAASILHHTWGIEDTRQAVAIYDRLDEADSEEFAGILNAAEDWGIYEAFESMSVVPLWNNIWCLAASIDRCREELT